MRLDQKGGEVLASARPEKWQLKESQRRIREIRQHEIGAPRKRRRRREACTSRENGRLELFTSSKDG
eukprot:5912364-Pleurochrysis_carterae.AAC.1